MLNETKTLNKDIIDSRFIGFDCDYASSDIVLFGAGFDGTTSYRPGTRLAGQKVRGESYALETYSPYLEKDLCDINAFDSGELELIFGNTTAALSMIKSTAKEIIGDNKIPIMIGGEHLTTLPVVEACVEKHKNLCIAHFDAHTDLRDEYLGEKLSHASVMRRCYELVGDNRIFSFGIRSGTKEEFEWAKGKVCINKNIDDLIKLSPPPFPLPLYITIDVDVLDPSEFPATGTPEAGGWRFDQLRQSIKSLCDSFNIIGADIVEYSPPYDLNGMCATTTGKLLRELVLSINKKGK